MATGQLKNRIGVRIEVLLQPGTEDAGHSGGVPGLVRLLPGVRTLRHIAAKLDSSTVQNHHMAGRNRTNASKRGCISQLPTEQTLHAQRIVIEPGPDGPRFLETVRGLGYRFSRPTASAPASV